MKLRINAAVRRAIDEMGADAYPHEGVALLIGREAGGAKVVERVARLKNMNTARAHDRFEIDHVEYMAAEDALAGSGLAIVGFVHSHPDHPSAPSETDRTYFQFWPEFSCAIVAVEKGKPTLLTSWVIREIEGRFEPEEIEWVD